MRGVPPATPGPGSSGGGFPVSGWLVVGCLLWLILQFSLPGARARWKSRWEFWAPLLSVVASDLHAMCVRPFQIRLQAWRFRRELG